VNRWLLALLLVAAGAPGAPAAESPAPDAPRARDALHVLDACIEQLDRGLDIGYARIAARCPELTGGLLQSPWAPWLPSDWNKADNQLSAQGLSELRDLLTRESAPTAAGRVLHADRERIAAVLAAVARAPPPPAGWWARFKQWLRGLFAPRPQEDAGWWRRLFGEVHLEQAVVRGIVWVSLALIVALAVALVLNELRVAGVLRTRKRGRLAVAPPSLRAGPSLARIERARAAEQPALLLEFIASRLAEQDRLPPPQAFTAQELTRRARLQQESDRLRLAELAAVCEQVRFSGLDVAPQVLAGALARGRELLAALEIPAAAAGAG